ncbi:MAG: alpha/beta fold hydrolase [Bacteroidota bacterium]
MATFILIHGSFHAAWNWHKVVPLLEKEGHKAYALDMPGHGLDKQALHTVSLEDCVQKVLKEIDKIEGEIMLVAHSRNGMVISQVAEFRPKRISCLVYLAAYLIPHGKSMMEYAKEDTASLVYQNIHPKVKGERLNKLVPFFKRPLNRKLFRILASKKQKLHVLDPGVYQKALYHDCPEEITELAQVLLSPEPNLPGFEPLQLTKENYGSIPKCYIECLEDRAVSLNLQRKMQGESPCEMIYQLNSSHSPFFSMPRELVGILIKASNYSCLETGINIS